MTTPRTRTRHRDALSAQAKATRPRRGAALAAALRRPDRRRQVRRQRDDRRRASSSAFAAGHRLPALGRRQARRRARRRPADLVDARPARHRERVPRRAAGHHPRGDGRRPDGARRPGRSRAGRPDQRARWPRRSACPARTPACSGPSAAGTVVDGEEVDLGLVGDVVEVDPAAVLDLIEAGRIPVVSTVAPDDDGQVLNVNADTAAAALAVALGAAKLVVLTDVEGLYADWPDRASLLAEITRRPSWRGCCPAWSPGWCPRWRPACAPSPGASREATVIDGRVPHSVLLEVFTPEGVGTMVLPDAAPGPGAAGMSPRPSSMYRPPACRARRGPDRYAAALMNTFGTPQRVLVRGEGCLRLGRRRQPLPRPARRASPSTRSATPTPSSPRRSRHSWPPSATSRTSSPPPRRSRSPSGSSTCSTPRPARGCSSRNSGTEANEAAFKLTRRTGRTGMVAAEGAFHGRTMGALALTHKAGLPRAVRAAARRRRPRARSATSTRSRPPSAPGRPPSSSSRSRARPGVRSRPAGLPRRGAAIIATRPARCSSSTRCRPASAGPAPGSPTSTPPRRRRRARTS